MRVRFSYPAREKQFFNMGINNIIAQLHNIEDDYLQTPRNSILEAYRRQYPMIVNEGLIKTYPTDMVAETIAQLFKLDLERGWKYGDNGHISIKRVEEKENELGFDDVIRITLNAPVSKGLTKQINNYMLKYGWFLGANATSNDCVIMEYEKKFGDRYSVKDLAKRQDDKYLYHITSSKIAEKIKKQGFIPKTHTSYLIDDEAFKIQPEEANRVYFFIERPADFTVKYWGSVAQLRTGGVPVLIVLDPELINDKISFFADPRWKNGVFTYEPIPPSAIVAINEF